MQLMALIIAVIRLVLTAVSNVTFPHSTPELDVAAHAQRGGGGRWMVVGADGVPESCEPKNY